MCACVCVCVCECLSVRVPVGLVCHIVYSLVHFHMNAIVSVHMCVCVCVCVCVRACASVCVQEMYQQGALRHRQRVEEMKSYRAKLQADCRTRRLVLSLHTLYDACLYTNRWCCRYKPSTMPPSIPS